MIEAKEEPLPMPSVVKLARAAKGRWSSAALKEDAGLYDQVEQLKKQVKDLESAILPNKKKSSAA